MDKVTLNIGVRFDAEYMYNQTGALALALNNQWAPRIGLIWDPTYQGKSKIYASYAFYYEAVPLDLADRSLIGNEFISALHFGCTNPSVTGSCAATLRQILLAAAVALTSTGAPSVQTKSSSTRTSVRRRRTKCRSAPSTKSSPTDGWA